MAIGGVCIEIAMPIGRQILLRDAPPIFWRKLQEDLKARVAEITNTKNDCKQ